MVQLGTNTNAIIYESAAISNQINIYELILVCSDPGNMRMISETAYSTQTKLIGEGLLIWEHGIGYSNLTPDPQRGLGGPRGSNFKFRQIKKLH